MDRVGSQPRRIVAIGVAAGDGKEPMAQLLAHPMLGLAGLPPIGQAGREPSAQVQKRIAALEQDGSTIRAALALVER